MYLAGVLRALPVLVGRSKSLLRRGWLFCGRGRPAGAAPHLRAQGHHDGGRPGDVVSVPGAERAALRAQAGAEERDDVVPPARGRGLVRLA